MIMCVMDCYTMSAQTQLQGVVMVYSQIITEARASGVSWLVYNAISEPGKVAVRRDASRPMAPGACAHALLCI